MFCKASHTLGDKTLIEIYDEITVDGVKTERKIYDRYVATSDWDGDNEAVAADLLDYVAKKAEKDAVEAVPTPIDSAPKIKLTKARLTAKLAERDAAIAAAKEITNA